MNWIVFLGIGFVLTLVLLDLFGIIKFPELPPSSTPTIESILPVEQTPEIEHSGCLEAENKIAFVSNRDGNNEIYVMNANGSCQTNISENPADDFYPQWVSDNNSLIFLSNRKGHEGRKKDLYIKDMISGHESHVSELEGYSYSVAPGGDYILYGREYLDSYLDVDNVISAGIYKIDISTGSEKRFCGLLGSTSRFSNFDINQTEGKIIFDVTSVYPAIGIVNTDGSDFVPYDLDSDPMSSMEIYEWREEKYFPAPGGMPPDTAYSPKWDDNGQSFYYIDPTRFVISDEEVFYVLLTEYDLQTNSEKEIFRFPEGSFTTIDNYPPGLYTVPNSELIIIQDGFDFFSFEKTTQEYSLITNGLNPTFSNDGSKMIFERDGDIFSINLDGTGEVQLTQNNGENKQPVWQPSFVETKEEDEINQIKNLDKIVFTSLQGMKPYDDGFYGTGEIFIMNSDGTEQIRLTNNENEDSLPVWSPDKQRIVFSHRNEDSSYDLFIINQDGSDLTQLTDNPQFEPCSSWSPDGSKLACSSMYSSEPALADIFLMEPNGNIITYLTDNNGRNTCPSFSPDGEEIIFSSNRDGDWKIYKMKVDGSKQKRITRNEIDDELCPSISPDGSRILFSSERDGDSEIFMIDKNGRNLVQLTDNDWYDSDPTWSPDGNHIAFVSQPGYDPDIYVMDSDGENIFRITDNGYWNRDPKWSP